MLIVAGVVSMLTLAVVLHTSIATAATTSSSCLSSQLLQDIELLPDFLSEVVVHFHCVPKEDVGRLTRYLVAYNGEVDESLSEKTTHILCHSAGKVRKCCR